MEGNQYWKLRKKNGKTRKFATPEALWQAACNYFEWCEANPLTKKVFKGSPIKELQLTIPRPFTLSGFCLSAGIGINYLNQLKARLGPEDQELLFTIIRIEDIIYEQQFAGAVVGIYKPLIIARTLSLRNKNHHNYQQVYPLVLSK